MQISFDFAETREPANEAPQDAEGFDYRLTIQYSTLDSIILSCKRMLWSETFAKTEAEKMIVTKTKQYLPIIEGYFTSIDIRKDEQANKISIRAKLTFDPHQHPDQTAQADEALTFWFKEVLPLIESGQGLPKAPSGFKSQLFPNAITEDGRFGITRGPADLLNNLFQTSKDKERTKKRFTEKTYPNERRKRSVLVTGESETPNLGHSRVVSFDRFYVELLELRDAKVIQVFCALYFYACQTGTWHFSNVRLTEFMKITHKGDKNGSINQQAKREFCSILRLLTQFHVELNLTLYEPGRKHPRHFGKPYPLFWINELEYATKRDGTKDTSVFNIFDAELLPEFNKSSQIARVYGPGILEMDANKDRNAIELSFYLQTRLGQVNQQIDENETLQPTRFQRSQLIELANLKRTDKSSKAKGSLKLQRALDKLVQIGDILKYSPIPIPNDDHAMIYIYPAPHHRNVDVKKYLESQACLDALELPPAPSV